jgi:hypothetical protein
MDDSASSQPDEKILEMASALESLRDSWVKMSLILKDHAADLATQQRDEVMTEVERYLSRLQESNRRPSS